MTTKTADFSNLLYYNPATHGFNPVVSATIECPDSMNEYDSITVNVVTWNLSDRDLFWRVVPFGTNLTLDRFTLGSSDSTPLVNNRASFTIAVSADNATSADGQSFDIIVSKTLNGPALVTKYGVNVNDTSQDPQILTMDLDPKNYVPASSSTITITTTFSSDYAGGFPPPNTGGSFIRYNGDIATQPSVGDTFDWNGTIRTIAQVMGFETYGASYQYYFIGFYPSVGQGEIGVGQSIDITHGNDGLSITDASGQGNLGRLYGDISWSSAGDSSYFTLSNGTYISVPALQNSAYKSVTMSMWFNSTNTYTGGSLITKELAYKSRVVPANGGLNLSTLAGWGGSAWLYNEVNTTLITNNVWHHYAVTISPTVIAIYLDGQQIATAAGVGALPANTQPLMIGSYGDGSGEFFNGKIGPARLYTYALAEQDVQDYYTSTAGRYGVYAHMYASYSPPGIPTTTMIFYPAFTQDVTGWTISGYNCPAGVTVISQTALAFQTQLELSQPIDTFAVMYSFRAP